MRCEIRQKPIAFVYILFEQPIIYYWIDHFQHLLMGVSVIVLTLNSYWFRTSFSQLT